MRVAVIFALLLVIVFMTTTFAVLDESLKKTEDLVKSVSLAEAYEQAVQNQGEPNVNSIFRSFS